MDKGLWRRGVLVWLLAGAAGLTAPARGQMIDRTQSPNVIERRHRQVAGRADRARPWRLADAGIGFVHHQPRPVSRDSPRAPALSAQVHAPAAPGPRRRRRAGRHQHAPDDRRGAVGQLRELPRPAARIGGGGGRRRDASRQPRLHSPLRPGPEGDARRRDDAQPARSSGIRRAPRPGAPARRSREPLVAKGVSFGAITARADGTFDVSAIEGVDPDLRIRPFFAHGGTISIREFVVGALRAEMGLEVADPDTAAASSGARVSTPSGMVLDGRADKIEAPPVANPHRQIDGNVSGGELPTAIVDYLEFYLLNYFKPATYKQTDATRRGLQTFQQIGCASCHVPELSIARDRRVADVETVYDPERGILNALFATAAPRVETVADGSALPARQAGPAAAFRRTQHLHGLQAPRPRARVPRTQLGRHDAEGVPDPAALGRRQQDRLRPRRHGASTSSRSS